MYLRRLSIVFTCYRLGQCDISESTLSRTEQLTHFPKVLPAIMPNSLATVFILLSEAQNTLGQTQIYCCKTNRNIAYSQSIYF
jgi:hypothetical protein